MALSIQPQPGQGNISGHLTVHQPLSGSGPFTGTVNTSTDIQFTVTGKNTSPLYFWGLVQSNGDLNGNYCSLNGQNQCDPRAGASGTWNAAPATGTDAAGGGGEDFHWGLECYGQTAAPR